MDEISLKGKTAIVTGANGGIGRETAKQLARRGARVVIACRDLSKGEEAKRLMVESDQVDKDLLVVKHLDLASLRSVREFADDINRNEHRLDILVNNAGVIMSERRLTEDNFETHFAVNHLGHFLLTYLLLPKLEFSQPSRVVTVSSVAHYFYDLDFNDLQTEVKWNAFKAYGRSKTANILFSSFLPQLLKDRGVTSYCLHPGLVRTDLGRNLERSFAAKCLSLLWTCFRVRLLTPEEGARTTLYCCLEPSIATISGKYYSECKEKRTRLITRNSSAAERLWKTSCVLCQVPFDPFTTTTPVQSPPMTEGDSTEKSTLLSVEANDVDIVMTA